MTTHIHPLASESLAGLQPWVHPEGHRLDAYALSQQQQQQASISKPPPGFPAVVDGPMTWSGSGSQGVQLRILELDESSVAEIEDALQSFHSLELDGDEASRGYFPLPNLREQLEKCALEVHRGSGICIIRGLNPENYTIEDNIVLFLALASYIGDQRGLQGPKGNMLSHITELKSWTVPRDKRHGIHTNDSLPFHNDMGCEILSIQVRDRANAGGHTCVASAAAIYNHLLRSNPRVLHALVENNWPIQASSKKGSPFVLCPLLEFHDDHLFISMDPARIGPHPSDSTNSIPSLTSIQQEALAALQTAARKHQVRLETRPGDLLFLNNLGLLHARESYQDGPSSSRHLVRLWLRNTQLGWPIPRSMAMPWDAAFGEPAARVVNKYYPVMPMPEYMGSKFSNGTAAFVADDESDDDSGGGSPHKAA
ncbi:Clavaminate synthase-like protein [Durotheca rogersii]|uniref:Clavaminate synthase-like protein n=1 Tax=Durotheca rogersii TaxID=419775 RepID=UPI0022211274|nr:Clavaminate synthase-like protein [Durotheca rogersii]KAI5865234.1 Clavaminate synthase-like protein [Durotheca rogersii]